jgi:hypothetical protein
MAKAGYSGVDNIARKIKKGYVGHEDGLAKKLKKAYVGDENGIAKLVLSSTPKMIIYTGSTIYISEDNGNSYERVFTKPSDTTYSFSCMTYGNGKFVLLCSGTSSSPVYTSEDGITWTISSSFSYVNNCNICFGNGMFLASFKTTNEWRDSSRLYKSTDGISWTSVSTPASCRIDHLEFGKETFFVIGTVPTEYANTTKYIHTSKDLVSWKSYSEYDDISIYNVAFSDNYVFITYYSSVESAAQKISLVTDLPSLRMTTTNNYYKYFCYTQGCFGTTFISARSDYSFYMHVTNPMDETTYVTKYFPSGCTFTGYIVGEKDIVYARLKKNNYTLLYYSTDGINWYPTNININNDIGSTFYICKEVDGGKTI